MRNEVDLTRTPFRRLVVEMTIYPATKLYMAEAAVKRVYVYDDVIL